MIENPKRAKDIIENGMASFLDYLVNNGVASHRMYYALIWNIPCDEAGVTVRGPKEWSGYECLEKLCKSALEQSKEI